MMITIRELSNHTSKVLQDVAESGRPAIVTNNGRPVAAVMTLDSRAIEALEDYVLMTAPEYLDEMEGADVARTRDARTVQAEQAMRLRRMDTDAFIEPRRTDTDAFVEPRRTGVPGGSALPLEHALQLQTHVPNPIEASVNGIVKHLGIALQSRDASLVACSDKSERDRIRDSFLKGKLGLTQSDAELDAAILDVCQKMSGDRGKSRVTFYYLLAEKYKKLDTFA